MQNHIGTIVIRNGQLIDGQGGPPVANAVVVVKDGKITWAGPANVVPPQDPAARVIDAKGGSILPGLVEAHFHPTYFNVAALEDLDIKYPVEYVTLLAAANAKLAVECGYTSARSGEGDRIRYLRRPASRDQRARNLRRRRPDGLESGLPQNRHGGPGAAD